MNLNVSELLGGSKLTKAKFKDAEKGNEFEVHFNPTSFKVVRKRTWKDGDQFGALYPSLQYSGVTHDTLSMSLILDESEPKNQQSSLAPTALMPPMTLGPLSLSTGPTNDDSVQTSLDKLFALTTPSKRSAKDGIYVRPPIVTFTWGDFYFYGAITDLTVEVYLFDSTGKAKRAKVDVTMLGRTKQKVTSADVQKATEPVKVSS